MGVSLDGFISRDNGDISRLTNPPVELARAQSSKAVAHDWENFFPTVDHVVMGRKTYNTVKHFDEWSQMWNGTDVLVLSKTLSEDTPPCPRGVIPLGGD